MSDELIREVNEAMRQAQMQALWKRYGKQAWVIGGLVLLFCIATMLWQQQSTANRQEQTDLILQGREALAAKKFDEAKGIFAALAADSKGNVAAIANVWLAKAEAGLDNNEAALNAYAAAVEARDPKAPGGLGVYQSYACLNGALLAPADARFSNCLPTEAGQPLFALAAEIRAVDAALDPKADTVVLPNPLTLPLSQKQRVDDLNVYLSSKSQISE